MKLTYFQGPQPNFGDELNAFLWEEILPAGFLDADPSELFLGIGSILWDSYPRAARKIVAGSGYGGYTSPPDMNDGTWEVIFVRGPRTAAKFGLPPEKAISDSAVLLRLLPSPEQATEPSKIAFMPHFESLERGFWPQVCERAQVPLIDPRGDPHAIMDKIRSVDVLVTEAMHGAIVADALRTPWICARPVHAMHQAKWLDWSESLDIDLRSHPLPPSNLQEWYQSRLEAPVLSRGQATSDWPVFRPLNEILISRAADRLAALAREEPQLSRDDVIERATSQAAGALDQYVKARGFDGLKL